jgi:DNA-binding NtrC family response regulator
MMTGHASVETAVDAMRQGAFDYLVKPLRMEAVGVVVAKAFESRRLRQECKRLRRQIEDRYSARTLVGTSEVMRKVFQLVHRVGPSPSPVLICGEAGVGKARIARAIHEVDRCASPFVTVDCTTIEAPDLERVLFGGPDPETRGAIDRAGSGSLLLRDVCSMPMAVQARLAEYLEDRASRNGRSSDRKSCRLLASSRTDPELLRKEGRFREDLFYRLHVVRFDIPALRERREDIPVYLSHFLRESAESLGIPPKALASEARAQIMDYPWPGNVRQLENAIERAMALAYGREIIVPDDLPAEVQAGKSVLIPWLAGKTQGDSLPEILTAFEQQMLLQALERANWVKTRAAAMLKIKRTTLIEKMKRLGIPLKDGRWQTWA